MPRYKLRLFFLKDKTLTENISRLITGIACFHFGIAVYSCLVISCITNLKCLPLTHEWVQKLNKEKHLHSLVMKLKPGEISLKTFLD